MAFYLTPMSTRSAPGTASRRITLFVNNELRGATRQPAKGSDLKIATLYSSFFRRL